MKKMKLTSQQIKFIINMVCMAIFTISYVYIYTGFEEKTETTYAEIKLMQASIDSLNSQKENEPITLENTQTMKGQIQEIIDNYPVNIAKENSFLFVEQMQKDLDITLSSISISDGNEIFTTVLPIRNEDGTEVDQSALAAASVSSDVTTDISSNIATADNDNATVFGSTQTEDLEALEGELSKETAVNSGEITTENENTQSALQTMRGYEAVISMNFTASYDGFKELVDYIADYPEQTVIDSVSVSYDITTGYLTGSLVIKRYALTGSGKIYEEPMIDDISIGTDNIFGSEVD